MDQVLKSRLTRLAEHLRKRDDAFQHMDTLSKQLAKDYTAHLANKYNAAQIIFQRADAALTANLRLALLRYGEVLEEELGSYCMHHTWCVLQRDHQGQCSPSFFPDDTRAADEASERDQEGR
jgi:hypothetical protein